jgi:hypothetical protein
MAQPNGKNSPNQGSAFRSSTVSVLGSISASKYNESDLNARKFLWQGGKSNEKKISSCNWNVVKNPREHGGLGIRDLALMN